MTIGYGSEEAQRVAKEGLMQQQQWPPYQGGIPGSLGTPLTPAASVNEQIRALVSEVADAADVVAERRQNARQAAGTLAEAEQRFGDLAGQMAKLLANHKAMGDPNAPKAMLP